MSLQKLLCCVFSLVIILSIQQLGISQEPSYLEEGNPPAKGDELVLREKMEQVRKEINKLNEKLEENFQRLHELEKKLEHGYVEKKKHELEKFISEAKDKVEHLKKERAPEEQIRKVIEEIEHSKKKLESIRHPLEFDEQAHPEERDFDRPVVHDEMPEQRVIIFRLKHAPAEYIAYEILEDFVTPEIGIVKADPRTNSLIIRDIEPNLHQIEMIIHELDLPEGEHPMGFEMMIPEHGRAIAELLEIKVRSIIVRFPEHHEWHELKLLIPHVREDREGVDREKMDMVREIVERIRNLEVGMMLEIEWKRDDEGRFWITQLERIDSEERIGQLQEMTEHALRAKEPEEAVARFENVLEQDPECRTMFGKAAQIMVGVNLMKLGKLEEAENEIKIGLNLFPENILNLWKTIGFEALGHIYHERDDLEQAVEVYNHAIHLYDEDRIEEREEHMHELAVHQKSIRINLARIYIQTDKNELAQKTLKSAIELTEEEIPRLDAHANLLLGELEMKNENTESAINHFKKVLNLSEKPEAQVNEKFIKQAKDYLEKLEESE